MKTYHGKAEDVQHSENNTEGKFTANVQLSLNENSFSYDSSKKLHLAERDELTIGSGILGKDIHNHTKGYSTAKPLILWVGCGFIFIMAVAFEIFLAGGVPKIKVYDDYSILFLMRILYVILLIVGVILAILKTNRKRVLANKGVQ